MFRGPLRRCPVAIAQRLVFQLPCWAATRTMSVTLLLRNSSKRKKFNFRSPAPPPKHDLFWVNLKVQLHLPPLDLLISPGTFINTTHHSSTLLNFCLAGTALRILDIAQPCYNRTYCLTGCETPSHFLRIRTHEMFIRTLIYYDTDIHSSNFCGNPLCQATK